MSAAPSDVGLWGVVEIMGRRTRAGLLSDATIGGATLLRIEHPSRADETGAEPLAEYYSPAAIFAIRPCTRDTAERVAAWAWPAETARPALPPAFAELVEPDDDDDDDPADDDRCADCDRPLNGMGECPKCDQPLPPSRCSPPCSSSSSPSGCSPGSRMVCRVGSGAAWRRSGGSGGRSHHPRGTGQGRGDEHG